MAERWKDRILEFFGNGSEADVRRQEDERMRRERERRRLARIALAHQKELMAEEKRLQASYQDQRQLRLDLLREAEQADRDATRLKSGEIGLLEAMGISVEDPE